jgi:NifU-like protein involved in Fe-S cluster formation
LPAVDALKLTFKVDGQGKIQEAEFKTFGCASAIAAASALTEMIKGMTVEEAGKLTNVIEKFPPVIEELRTMSPYW